MALSPSMSVPLGSRGVYECSVLSCAWKAPRVLSGSFASTTQSSSSSSSYQTHKWRTRSGSHLVSKTKFNKITRKSDSSLYKRFLNTNSTLNDKKWRLWCSSSESYDSINPESLWESLKPSISYLPPKELNLVHDSLKLAFEAHNGQKRKSGEPFIIHPVEVARILGELELDWESIAAGLLHDTVEDTDLVTFESIEKEFGSTVRNIVEGETKVSKLGKIKRKGDESNSKQDVKADDLIQMFLAMTEDVRVIIVKLADRLHNMRTLSHMPPHKQSAIARETLKVFAPLAKRLGMYQIKAELEYLSFMYTNPSDFHKLSERVEEFCRVHEKELEEAKRILKKKIEEDQYLNFVAVQTEVHSCYKELYSTYETMLQSTNSMSEVNLIAQLRIVIKPKTGEVVGPFCSPQQVCYHVLGLVHGIWTPVPQAVKDYIATPKPNAYQSLHTTVIPFLKESMFRLEVQIRTEAMDLIAERGIAAHYSGKQGTEIQFNNTGKALRIGWLNAIKEWQEEFVGNMSSREFVDAITVDLLGSRVFVFTPKGEIKDLPKGATVIDYAYLIHTEIGNKMIGAKVNGNKCSPIHELANAEVVEIITSDTIPSKIAFEWHEQWLQHAKTRSARHKIMKFLREQAQLCALELTADRVSDFVADLDADKKQLFSKKPSPNKTPQKALNIGNNHSMKAQKDLVHVNHITASFPKRAPKFNGSGLVKDHELLETVETWKADKIAAWHSVEGNSVNWLCIVYIVCVERRGMMAEVTSALTANRISICSCAVETDRRKGLGVMVFHFEGSHDNLGNAFKSIGEIQGVLGRSVGCSWMIPSDNHWSI